MDKLILIVEKASFYLNQYVFIGNEALVLKKELEDKILLKHIDDRQLYISVMEELFLRIDDAATKSIFGTAGFKVFRCSSISSDNIVKYTIQVNGNFMKYDSFFNNEGLKYEDTGELIYFEYLPKNGVFKGKDICENISIDSDYFTLNKKLYDKFIFNFNSMFGFISLFAFISLFLKNTMFSVSLILLLSVLFLNTRFLFDFIKDSMNKKYKNPFFIKQIDYVLFKIGTEIELRDIIKDIFVKFDSTLGNLKTEELEWIKEYQLQKNH